MVDKFKKYFSFLFFLIFAFGASSWGGFVTSIYKEPWYSTLTKPSFNPPDYVFPSIWIFLYVAMAYAVWLIWINPKKTEKIIYIYFIHLLVNASWSVVFFALHQIFLALVVIVIILFLVLWLIKLYYPINKVSAYLMVPYVFWLVFALVLNLNILLLN
ncbi:tryptophan-rich sensory protein [Pelagibacteraceae bacterium]|nr:tryptophan-rich sensory protein [Pelagibacteraceae bacterium]|tara:strand:+ start:654 stop:1127 length:474 start_codon:yes stop_codon:yes gene_type:complete